MHSLADFIGHPVVAVWVRTSTIARPGVAHAEWLSSGSGEFRVAVTGDYFTWPSARPWLEPAYPATELNRPAWAFTSRDGRSITRLPAGRNTSPKSDLGGALGPGRLRPLASSRCAPAPPTTSHAGSRHRLQQSPSFLVMPASLARISPTRS